MGRGRVTELDPLPWHSTSSRALPNGSEDSSHEYRVAIFVVGSGTAVSHLGTTAGGTPRAHKTFTITRQGAATSHTHL